jgi:diguanylate cyclase (GGDEF)-like protein
VGRDEYRFATKALRASGYLRVLKVAIAGLCLSMAVLGWIVQFHPLGPHGAVLRLIHLVVSSSAAVVGIGWLIGRWPTYPMALAFVVWADISLAIAAAVLSAPESRLCATIHIGLIGVFVAFLLGKRVLAAHCAFATMLIIALTAYSAVVDHVPWFDLYIFFAPALSSVVVLPIVIQAVIEGGRHAVRRTVRDALHDPMTGLYNRRGMYAAASKLATDRRSDLLVAAVIDLDQFKDLNDNHGHDQGDAALKTLADALRSCIRSGDIVARTGGDEFVVIAALDSIEVVDRFIERLRIALLTAADAVTASVGIAWQSNSDDYDDHVLNAVLRRADTAMYDAKRQGGNQVIHCHPTN